MIGKELKDFGAVHKSEHASIVHLELKKDATIPSHNHEGREIFFVVVKGSVEVYLNAEETHVAEPGKIISFDGKNFISAKAIEDSEIFVFLVK